MIPFQRKKERKRILHPSERGKGGSGQWGATPASSKVCRGPENMNFEDRDQVQNDAFAIAVAMPHWLPQGRAFL